MKNSFLSASFYFAALTSLALGQGNGKLQLHFMDVGQGDGAVLISPLGEVVLFDGGNAKDCNKPVSHLLQLAVKKIDYAILSHYHADHFGCATEIFSQSPLQQFAYDRGGSYNSTNYKDYIQAVGQHRRPGS